jgi:putative radical SAM enzyme (TIGR03279 family)
MVEILKVEPGSIAARFGLVKGDLVLSINGQPLDDYIDYLYKTGDIFFTLEVQKKNGKYRELRISREPGQELGIAFSKIIFNGLKRCNNNCLFCFVDQQPSGMRSSLLIKDDDYRFSFLQGSFITLTNLSEEEFKRIMELRLSPLNISVHTTNPLLRVKMMRNPEAGKIRQQLKRLAGGGISFNAQVVLCPGLNDEEELDRTIEDLLDFYPQINSLGIVPVGLTKYRKGLYPLKGYNSNLAGRVIKQIKEWQFKLKGLYKQNLLYAADEFYFLSGEKLPIYEEYNDFPQIENGIGLTRLFWHDFSELEHDLPDKTEKELSLGIVTGKLGALVLEPISRRLNLINGLELAIIPVTNHFFGQSVTVTGLLTARDIISCLSERGALPDIIVVPGVVLNQSRKFLDDLTFNDLEKRFPEKNFFLCNDMKDVMEVIVDG